MTPDLVILAIYELGREINGKSFPSIYVLYQENGIKKLEYFERLNENHEECYFVSSCLPETCGVLDDTMVSIDSVNPLVYKVAGYSNIDDIFLRHEENARQYLLEKYDGYIGELSTIL